MRERENMAAKKTNNKKKKNREDKRDTKRRDASREKRPSPVAIMRKKRRELMRISNVFSDHVSEFGMSNALLDAFARQLCPNYYRGVVSAWRLRECNFRKPFTIICNIGLHFVTIHAGTGLTLYMDSYGKQCKLPSMLKFLTRMGKPVCFNERRIQLATSQYCGLYALLFAAYTDLKDAGALPFRLAFSNRACLKNDKLCKMYLHKLLNYLTKK